MSQVVDTESAQEFMREALKKISEPELDAIADQLEVKHEAFKSALTAPQLREASLEVLRPVLRHVFATRRRVRDLLEDGRGRDLPAWVADLVQHDGSIAERFETFCGRLGWMPESIRYDLASELLHYTAPEQYWLWARWVWDPHTRTGGLPLVIMEEYDLQGENLGETYLRVGRAMAFVHETGKAIGFTRIGDGRFGVDVYLACVYAVYVYTTVRMRMTQEFNKVIPPLPELCRRFLGVYKMEF